jgi:hypothetical protein
MLGGGLSPIHAERACSAAVAKLRDELSGRENRKLVAEDDQVLVPGHEVRLATDRESEEVVVVEVA